MRWQQLIPSIAAYVICGYTVVTIHSTPGRETKLNGGCHPTKHSSFPCLILCAQEGVTPRPHLRLNAGFGVGVATVGQQYQTVREQFAHNKSFLLILLKNEYTLLSLHHYGGTPSRNLYFASKEGAGIF